MRQYSPNGFSRPGPVNKITAKLLQRARSTITALSLLTFGALVAGCGSGGGGGDTGAGISPQTVNGVAATGSPLVGQVTLRDASSKDKTSNLASDGAFAIDVSDMTAPFVLKATGTADGVDRTLFSFADKPGIANVNPLTTVALANAAGVDDPASVFDKPDAATLAKVKSGMAGSVATVQTKLNPLLNAFSVASTNPVNAPFAADHSGLDGVFDNVKVVIANGSLTITNATTGAVLFTAQLRDIEHGRFTDNDDDVPKPGPRPAAPTGVTAVGGDGQVTVSWDPVANATAYDLFYSTKSRVAEEEDNDDSRATVAKSGSSSNDGDSRTVRVKNVTSPFVITGLAPSTTYFVIVRAINNGRRGPPSAEVSATTTAVTPVPTIPAAPTGVSATGGTGQVTVNWTAVSGATSYNLYWSTTTGVTTANGTKISGIASPPAVHTGLTDNTTYFYVVTAMNSAGESAASAQVQATTLAATSTTTSTTATTSSTTAGSTTSTTAGATSSTAGTTTTTTLGGGGTTSTAPTTSTSTTTSTAPTTTTTTSTTSTTLALNGAALYTTNCANCHGPLATSEKRGASVADINAGIAGVSSMRNSILSTNGGIALTQAQIGAIATALQ